MKALFAQLALDVLAVGADLEALAKNFDLQLAQNRLIKSAKAWVIKHQPTQN